MMSYNIINIRENIIQSPQRPILLVIILKILSNKCHTSFHFSALGSTLYFSLSILVPSTISSSNSSIDNEYELHFFSFNFLSFRKKINKKMINTCMMKNDIYFLKSLIIKEMMRIQTHQQHLQLQFIHSPLSNCLYIV